MSWNRTLAKLGVIYQLNNNWDLILGLQHGAMIFPRSTQLNSLNIDQVQTSQLELGIDWAFYKKQTTELKLKLLHAYLFPSSNGSYSTQAGTAQTVALEAIYPFTENYSLFVNPYYKQSQQASQLSDQDLKAMGLGLGIHFNW